MDLTNDNETSRIALTPLQRRLMRERVAITPNEWQLTRYLAELPPDATPDFEFKRTDAVKRIYSVEVRWSNEVARGHARFDAITMPVVNVVDDYYNTHAATFPLP